MLGHRSRSSRLPGCWAACCATNAAWRIQDELQTVIHIRLLRHVHRGARLELHGGGVVLAPVALRSLELQRHDYGDGASNGGGEVLGGSLFFEESSCGLHLLVVWRVDSSAEEARGLVGLRGSGQFERARRDVSFWQNQVLELRL